MSMSKLADRQRIVFAVQAPAATPAELRALRSRIYICTYLYAVSGRGVIVNLASPFASRRTDRIGAHDSSWDAQADECADRSVLVGCLTILGRAWQLAQPPKVSMCCRSCPRCGIAGVVRKISRLRCLSPGPRGMWRAAGGMSHPSLGRIAVAGRASLRTRRCRAGSSPA